MIIKDTSSEPLGFPRILVIIKCYEFLITAMPSWQLMQISTKTPETLQWHDERLGVLSAYFTGHSSSWSHYCQLWNNDKNNKNIKNYQQHHHQQQQLQQ